MKVSKTGVDVVFLTLNAMEPCLRECVESIYQGIPVNRFIVVDGGSTDGTIEYLSEFPNVEIHYDREGTRATAREIGIGLVQTDWFIFVDSDCILSEDWFTKAEPKIGPDIGAIQGHDYPIYNKAVSDFGEAMISLRKLFGKSGSGALVPGNVRGFTGDVLIRSETVWGIKIPGHLHIYEDYYIKSHIERQGYKWLITEDPNCTHVTTGRKAKNAFHGGYLGHQVGFLSLRNSFIAALTIFPKVAYAFIISRNMKMVFWQISFQVYSFFGVLKSVLENKEKYEWFN